MNLIFLSNEILLSFKHDSKRVNYFIRMIKAGFTGIDRLNHDMDVSPDQGPSGVLRGDNRHETSARIAYGIPREN
jgi:hypothetical protein